MNKQAVFRVKSVFSSELILAGSVVEAAKLYVKYAKKQAGPDVDPDDYDPDSVEYLGNAVDDR